MLSFFTSSIDRKLNVTSLVAGLLPALIQAFGLPVLVRYVLFWGAIIGAGEVNAKDYPLIFNEIYNNNSGADANEHTTATHWVTNASTNLFGACNNMQYASVAPSCLITGSNSVCGISQATFTAPSGMSSYLWSISGNASISGSATGSSVTVNVSSSGTFTLSLTITDASNSSANCSKMVSIIAAPSCLVSGPTLVCSNTPGYTYSAPSGMSSYLWVVSGPATLVGSNTGSSISVTSGFAGAFQVQVTVTDANGCSRTCSTLGGNLPGPSCFIDGPATSCSNSTSNTFRSLSNFGITSYNWSISGNATIVGSTTGSSISVSAGSSGSYTVSLTLTNNDNCTTTCSETVNITAPPTCMIGGPTNVCSNSVANVFTGPLGMGSYSWSLTGDATITSSTTGSSITVDAGTSGSFTLGLNITDANGCSSTCSLPMTITEKPTVIANTNTQTICSNSSISTIVPTPSDGASISWTRDNETEVTGIPASGTGNISGTLVNTTNAPILVTFTITASVNGCHSEPVVSTVMVNAVPACPSLFSPSNGQLGVQANVGSLDWNDVPYATSYLVYLGTNAPNYNNVINGTSVLVSTISIGTLANSTNYGFRIVPVNDCGQATSCTAVTFSTCTPTFTCPANRDVNLNSNCALVVPDLVTGLAANPGCSSLTFTQNPTAGTAVPSSHNGTVSVVITPDNPAAASCTVTLTGKDVSPASISCPSTQTVVLDANCTATLPNYTTLATTGENCGVQTVTQSPAAGTSVSGAGNMTVTLTVTNINGLTNSCQFTVTKADNTPPAIVCKNTTVFIGNTGTYTLQPADVFNATASSDNCSGALTVTNIAPATVSCAHLNQTIPVMVTVRDGSGNTATCTAQITVQEGTALPIGWSSDNIGNANGAAGYKACSSNGTFAVSANGFSTSSSDVLHFTSQQLCGNGEIFARVATVSGGGWGGVMIRENLMPGAKKVTLKTQLNSVIRREIRLVTNGAAAILNFNRPQHVWLRLVRSGSTFTGYTSLNGTTWSFAFSATVSMAGCVQVGVFAESINANTTTTATFSNVSVSGSGSNLVAELANVNAPSESGEQVRIFPNPTTGEVTIDLDLHAGKPGTIQVFNALGALTTQERLIPGNPETHRLRIGDLAGVYTVVIQLEDSKIVRRVVVQSE